MNLGHWKFPFLVLAFKFMPVNAAHAIKIPLLVSVWAVQTVKTLNYVYFQ